MSSTGRPSSRLTASSSRVSAIDCGSGSWSSIKESSAVLISMGRPARVPAWARPSVKMTTANPGSIGISVITGRTLRLVPIGIDSELMQSILSLWAMKKGTGLLRVMTTVPVCRSIDTMFRVEVTFPFLSVKSESEAARAAAPSLTPSASRAMTLRTTSIETALAPWPEVWPSARTTERPPFGRSTTSRVSPLSDTAYLLVLAAAIWTSMASFYSKSQRRLCCDDDQDCAGSEMKDFPGDFEPGLLELHLEPCRDRTGITGRLAGDAGQPGGHPFQNSTSRDPGPWQQDELSAGAEHTMDLLQRMGIEDVF